MLFEALPADILALVLDGDLSWASIELWKSGNRLLMSKLMNGGVTDVSLSAYSWNNRTVWPECLKHFRLRSLRIKTVRSPQTSLQLREELKQLHIGLENLELEGHGVTQAFILATRSIPISPALQPASTASNSEQQSNTPTSNINWDLNATHPRLKSLTLTSWDPSTKSPSRLDFGSYALLPRTLTHLDVSGTQFILDKEDACHFPPELAILELNENSTHLDVGDLLRLPSSLTSLPSQDIFTDEALLAIISDMELLPNLTPSVRANIRLYSALPIYYENHGKEWPSTLNNIDINLLKPEIAWNLIGASLPPKLTSLVAGIDICSLITPDWLSSVLPISLTQLSLVSVPWATLPDASVWPPNLSSFTLMNDREFHPNLFKLLPRTSTHLNLNYNRRNQWNMIAAEPLSKDYKMDECEKETWNIIKLELRDSIKQSYGCYSEKRIERYILGVETGLLHGLPLSTTTLNMGYLDRIPDVMHLLLPPRLISMDWTHICFDNHLCGILPPRLTSAQFALEGHEATRSISPKAEEALRLSNISSLNLQLQWVPTSKLPVLAVLPQRLRELTLAAPGWCINDTHIAGLPQSITKLLLLCSLVVPEDSWSSALPRSIIDLTTSFTIHGSALRYLPALKKLVVPSIYSVTAESLQGPIPPCVVDSLFSSQLRPFGRPSWQALFSELKQRKHPANPQ